MVMVSVSLSSFLLLHNFSKQIDTLEHEFVMKIQKYLTSSFLFNHNVIVRWNAFSDSELE